MKKQLLFFAGLAISSLGFSQLYYGELDANAWIHPFWQTNLGDYTSTTDESVTYEADGDALKINFDTLNATTESEAIQFEPFNIGGDGAKDIIDISASKFVYLKLKGTKGDFVRVDLKNSAAFTFVDGYDLSQQITCNDYRWYKFDFSEKTDAMDQITQVAIAYNPAIKAKGSITIDSMIVGSAAEIESLIPFVPSFGNKFFITDMTNDYYKNVAPETSENSFAMVDDVFEATESPLANVGDGFGFTAFEDGSAKLIDIAANKIVKVIVKTDLGDTIRVNLKYSTDYTFIDGYDFFQIAASTDFTEYTFDFNSITEGDFTEIIAVDVSINPDKHDDKTFYIKDVQIGDDVCNDRVLSPISKKETLSSLALSVYPNPTSGVVTLNTSIQNSFTLNVYNTNGQLVKSQKAINGDQVSGLENGLYIFEVATENSIGTTKVLVK